MAFGSDIIGVGDSLDIGDRPHEKRHVDPSLRSLPRDVSEAAIGVDEIVLHIHNNKRRLTDLRSHHCDLHLQRIGNLNPISRIATLLLLSNAIVTDNSIQDNIIRNLPDTRQASGFLNADVAFDKIKRHFQQSSGQPYPSLL